MAMRWLARREYATRELTERLAQRGVPPDIVGEAVAELVAEGLVSDQRYAEACVRTRIRKRYGPLRILAELSQRGVADGVAEAALDADDPDWVALARSWLRGHGGQPEPADRDARARAYRRLQNRGFTHAQAMAALDDPPGQH